MCASALILWQALALKHVTDAVLERQNTSSDLLMYKAGSREETPMKVQLEVVAVSEPGMPSMPRR
jgi:hypothetical protein